MLSQYTSDIEIEAAKGNQTTYEDLKANYDCEDNEVAEHNHCTAEKFEVWKNVRGLVHTANNLTQNNCDSAICPDGLPVDFDMQIDERNLALHYAGPQPKNFQHKKI